MNHNKIFDIGALRGLKKLNTLSVFHNDIHHLESFISVVGDLPALEELCVDGNPMSADYGLKYQVIMATRVKMIDDERVTELDKELAKTYYHENNLKLPKADTPVVVAPVKAGAPGKEETGKKPGKENKGSNLKKRRVKFNDIDDDGQTWQDTELSRLEIKVAQLTEE